MNQVLDHRPSATARDVDVRGFVYALEPVRQRQQWRLDKLMSALARAQRALAGTEAEIDRVRALHDAQARHAAEALRRRMDPQAHRQALGFLMHLRAQRKQLEQRRDEQSAEKERLRKDCLELQLRLDGLARHKEDALTQYADEIRQCNSNEQDRDWLARSAAARQPSVEVSP